MSRPVHVEVQADDVERAEACFDAVSGRDQDPRQMTGSTCWGIVTGPGGKTSGLRQADPSAA